MSQSSESRSIGDVATLLRGVTFDKKDILNTHAVGYIPLLRAGNITTELDLHNDLIWVRESCVSSQQRLQKNDVVVCTSSGSSTVVGKSAWLSDDWEGTFGAFLGALRPRQIEGRYLAYFLRSPAFWAWRDSQAQGANIQNLKLSSLSILRLPYPTSAEQRRIADRLDAAMAEIAAARAALSLQREATTAAIEARSEAVFSQLAQQRGGAPFSSFADSKDAFRDGPFGSNLKSAHYSADGARVVRLQNIGAGQFLDEHKAFIPLTHFEKINGHAVEPGDIIVAALGDDRSRAPGRACLMPDVGGPAVVKADCFRVRLPSEKLRPAYASLFLNSPFARRLMLGSTRGATRPRINLSMLRTVQIPNASLHEQDVTIAHLTTVAEAALDATAAFGRQAAALDALGPALLSAAFRGDL